MVKGAVGGAAGVIHAADSATTDCQPNDNVEAMRMGLDALGIESRPLWKPMHCQPVYRTDKAQVSSLKSQNGEVALKSTNSHKKAQRGSLTQINCQTSEKSVAYINGVSEALFKVGMCLPAGPCVTDEDVKYICDSIKSLLIP